MAQSCVVSGMFPLPFVLVKTMTIDYLIKVLTNKLTRLKDARVQAEVQGELDSIIKIDEEIVETELTISQLSTL